MGDFLEIVFIINFMFAEKNHVYLQISCSVREFMFAERSRSRSLSEIIKLNGVYIHH